MGSLMAGWDSPVLDEKSVKYRRNRSLTKEEIDAYWKSKKKMEQEHLKSRPSDHTDPSDDIEIEANLEKTKKNDWWTRSNWAFLNEPPVSESTSKSYVSQFHVASMASSKLNHNRRITA